MNELQTYHEVCTNLSYDLGLVERIDQTSSPIQRHIFLESKRQIPDIGALYFSGEVPVIHFKLLNKFDEESVKETHRYIWNQNRIPLLYVITPGELRIYNCFETPAGPGNQNLLDTQERLIRHFNLAENTLKDFEIFSKPQIDSGFFWKSKFGQSFNADRRVDQRLLEELQTTREILHRKGLDYNDIHSLLGRSIFILYLEDRGAIKSDYYGRFFDGARSFIDILQYKDATYDLFDHLEKKFNGDLFPVRGEREIVRTSHLEQVQQLFSGTQMTTGQRSLWRPYDFGVIPIELISAIYEKFLHKEEGRGYTSEMGAYYTPHALVEFILNEVLPWPSEQDSRYDLRILDPACGSGIFLVESFRRLVSRWMFKHNKGTIPHTKLKEILTHYIFGVDINLDAIRVAAFSLYLALLDYLEPKTIWEDLRFPYLVHNPNKSETDGGSLFPMDAFPKEGDEIQPFASSDYDIIVGNPPWKCDGLPPHISEYCQKRKFAQEMSQAFLWRARDFSENGKLALVGTSNILVNTESNDATFRRKLFTDNYVETIINFSALRKVSGQIGKRLFTSAIGPASVFIYRVNSPDQPSSTVLYCTPKPTRNTSALPAIIIDTAEIKFLPREKCAESSIIWKIAMWATQRDFEVIEKLLTRKSLADYVSEKPEWHWAQGLQRPGETGPYKDEEIAKLSLIPTEAVKRYWVDKARLEKIDNKYFFRTGNINTYYASRVLLRRSPSKNRMQAVFVDFDCAFRNAVSGIAARNEDLRLKSLTAYLNSSFVPYFTFLTASLWGVERDQVSKSEFGRIPGVPFELSQDTLRELASRVELVQALRASGYPETDSQISEIEAEIDQIVYEALELSSNERILIDDMLKYNLDFFWKGDRSLACDSVNIQEIEDYAKSFCYAVNNILQFGQLRAWATVYTDKAPLRLVSIHFNRFEDANTVAKQTSSDRLHNALSSIEEKLETEYSESIYVRRNIRFYDGDTLHITKPDEKRFWTRSMALRDADETLAEGINSAK